MAKTSYRHAQEVQDIAEQLIEKYHGHFNDFNVHFDYTFVSKTPKRNGCEVWGQCRKISGFNAHISDQDDDQFFSIIISEDIWDILPQDKKEALVDHELCHAFAEASQKEDDDGSEEVIKLSMRPHDLEEFSCIVRRHGMWREDVEEFVKAAMKSKDKNDD